MEDLSVYKTLIRESHLDSFGHVNNAVYMKLFEEARWELIHARGYGMAEVQKEKKGPIVLEVSIQFKKELKLREQIEIHTKVLELRDRFFRLEQTILNEKGQAAAVAQFQMGFFDLSARKLVPMTPEWLRVFKPGPSGSSNAAS